jgi:protein-tyrosine-phosphatase
MARVRYASLGMLGLGIGYFLWYTPYSALAKALSGGLLPATGGPVGGLVLLPAAALGTLVAMPVTLTLLRWWKHARRRRLGGLAVPWPGRETAWSALWMALIVGSTTVNFTFPGVSILLMLVLMRISTLVISPAVDVVRRRRIRFYSGIAVALSLLSAVIALRDVDNYRLTLAAVLSLAAYALGYTGRFLVMSRHVKGGVLAEDRRYFVEEHMTTPVFLVILLGIPALLGIGSAGEALRVGFTSFLATPAALPAFGVGVLYEGLFVFTTLIFLDRREYSFCVPVHVCSSLLAGVAASWGLRAVFGVAPPSAAQVIAAVIVVVAALVLSYPTVLALHRQGWPLSRRVMLFVCGGNTVRSPMAAAIARRELVVASRRGAWRVLCAGVSVSRPGAPLGSVAAEALAGLGIPSPRHAARPVTPAMCAASEVVFCLTSAQRDAVVALVPAMAGRVVCLDPDGDVPEPDHDSVADSAGRIQALVRLRVTEWLDRHPVAVARGV